MSNKILVALDGSDGGNRALAAAVEQAKAIEAGMTLAYIIDWSPYSFHTPQELEERHMRRESEIDRAQSSVLQPAIDSLSDSGLSINSVVRHGNIAESLVYLAKKESITQIYLGRLGESKMRSMIFGSVTAALLQSSPVPVTVVP